jgi:hypothetical protein
MRYGGGRYSVACAMGVICFASLASGVVEPPSMLIPNYDRVLIGSQGALEAGAILCRAKSAEAGWYNPAGVVRGSETDINGNASLYEGVFVGFASDDTSSESFVLNTLPAFVGSSSPLSELDATHAQLSWAFTIATPSTWQMDLSSYEEFILPADPAAPTSVDGHNQITSTSNAEYSNVAMGGTISYAYSRDLTFGISGYLYNTSINLQKSRFDDWWPVGSPSTDTWIWSGSSLVSIEASHIGFNLGMYYQMSEHVQTAMVARLPGIQVSGTGTLDDHVVNMTELDVAPSQSTGPWDNSQYYQRDAHESNVEIDWQIPLQLDLGIAFSWDEGKKQLEFDMNYHAGTGTYDVFPSGDYYVRTGDIDSGSYTDTVLERSAYTTTGTDVVNWGIGYRYEMSDTKRFHAGFRTSMTHIEEGGQEDIFSPLDMYLVTTGMSFQTDKTFTSMGIAIGWGRTDSYSLQDLGTYEYVDGSLSITTISLVMGASFRL